MSSPIHTNAISITPFLLPEGLSHIDIFSTIEQQVWSIWLDSCESTHVDSRFDIIVWQPEVTLVTHDNVTDICALNPNFNQLNGQSTDDPLSLLQNAQDNVMSHFKLPDSDLPFIGGSLGYFAYDLGRRFEKMPTQAAQDISAPQMAVGIYSQALVYDKLNKALSLVCPEQDREAISQSIQNKLSNLAKNQGEDIDKASQSFSLTSDWQANMTKAAYQNKFEQVQDYLLSGDCYQINLAQRFNASYKGNEYDAYLTLREHNQAPFSAFMRFDQFSIISISPERFLQLNNGKVQSKPIKGTLPRGSNEANDNALADALAKSPKDRAENLMIVDLLRNDISRVCKPGTVSVPKLFDIESFPAVHHLVSTVEGELSEQYSATDLLRASFPGGSITGAPKIRAMEVIEELEPHRRSIYCGSIGYISACGNMDTSITIRTLICKNDTIYCWAGGGLVADSKVDNEYQETFDKVRKILPILSQQA